MGSNAKLLQTLSFAPYTPSSGQWPLRNGSNSNFTSHIPAMSDTVLPLAYQDKTRTHWLGISPEVPYRTADRETQFVWVPNPSQLVPVMTQFRAEVYKTAEKSRPGLSRQQSR